MGARPIEGFFCHACHHPCHPRSLLVVCGRGRGSPCSFASVFFFLARQAHGSKHRQDVISPPFVYIDRLGDSNATHFPTFVMPYCPNHRSIEPAPAAVRGFSPVAVRPINVDHAFVLSMAPQRLGRPKYHQALDWRYSGYGTAVPPYGGWTISLVFHHSPKGRPR